MKYWDKLRYLEEDSLLVEDIAEDILLAGDKIRLVEGIWNLAVSHMDRRKVVTRQQLPFTFSGRHRMQ